jgi:hypothetical protein
VTDAGDDFMRGDSAGGDSFGVAALGISCALSQDGSPRSDLQHIRMAFSTVRASAPRAKAVVSMTVHPDFWKDERRSLFVLKFLEPFIPSAMPSGAPQADGQSGSLR